MTKHSTVRPPQVVELSALVAEALASGRSVGLGRLVVTQEMVGRTILHEGTLIFAGEAPREEDIASPVPVARQRIATDATPFPTTDRDTIVLEVLRGRPDEWLPISQVAPQLLIALPALKGSTRNRLHMIAKRAAERLVERGLAEKEHGLDPAGCLLWFYRLAS